MSDQRNVQTSPPKLNSFGMQKGDKEALSRKINPTPGEDGV